MATNENYILPWFGARSEFGDFEPEASKQCFRIFKTKESYSNIDAMMTSEFSRLKLLATKLIKEKFDFSQHLAVRKFQFSKNFYLTIQIMKHNKTPSTWTAVGNPATDDERKLIFLLNFVRRKFLIYELFKMNDLRRILS